MINKIELYPLRIPFKEVFQISTATYVEQPYVISKVYTDDGHVGYGEACPAYEFTGETEYTVIWAIKQLLAKHILGRDPLDIETIFIDLENACVGNPSAKACIEVAIYDLIGKILNIPLWKYLGGAYRNKLLVSGTIGIMPIDKAVNKARRLVEEGIKVIKIKIGLDPDGDVERIRKIREAVGPEITIRVDANQGYKSFRQAYKVIRKIERFEPQLIEQPLPAYNLKGLSELKRRINIPLMLDESIHNAKDALRAISMDACDIINIKLMKAGGIREGLKIADLASTAGIECFMGGMGETGICTAAAIHIHCNREVIRYGDISIPHRYLKSDITKGLKEAAVNGALWTCLPNNPGLGIEIDNKELNKYLIDEVIVIEKVGS